MKIKRPTVDNTGDVNAMIEAIRTDIEVVLLNLQSIDHDDAWKNYWRSAIDRIIAAYGAINSALGYLDDIKNLRR